MKYFDKKNGHVKLRHNAVQPEIAEKDDASTQVLRLPLPIFPVVLVLVFSPLVADTH